MKVLLIGLGKMGQFHLKNLLEIKKIKKIYAFDISEKTFKIKDSKINYSTKIKSFDDKNVDFVDIVAPTQFHFDYLKKYIKQNKNIFIEKPIVSNIDEMKKIEKTIEKENYTGKIGVGFIERFNVVSNFLKGKIKEKGEPELLEIFRYNPGSDRIGGTNVTTDLMVHDLDLVNYFFDGKDIKFKGKSIEHSSSTILLNVNNTNITLSSNRITQQKIRQIKLYYDNLTIIGDLISGKIEMFHKPSEYFSSGGVNLNISYLVDEKFLQKTNQLKDELDEFVKIICGGKYINISDYEAGKNSIYILNKLINV